MDYVFDLDAALTPVFIDNLGTSIVEFALGYDLDSNEIVLFSVTLVPCDNGVSDLRFGIRTRDAEKDWKISGLDFSRKRVVECIPSKARKAVHDLLLAAVSDLAKAGNVQKITMETYYANLPPEALEKYENVTNVLIYNGFYVETKFRTVDGIDYWLYTKNPKAT
jgi:hypothetical protein